MGKSQPAKRLSGYTLLEAMIVLALVAVMIGVTAYWMQDRARNETRENWSLTQAKEMAMIAGAVQTYMDDPSNPSLSGLANNATLATTVGNYPTVAYLITQGLLPTDFARRRRADNSVLEVGISPLGQPYQVWIRKEPPPGSTVPTLRAVVIESGAHSPASFQRLGHQNTAAQVDAYKRDIGTRLERDFKKVGVVVGASTRIARSALSNFTKDLSNYLAVVNTTPLAAVLVNFSELAPDSVNPPPSGGPVTGSSCVVKKPSEAGSSLNCSTHLGQPFVPELFPSFGSGGALPPQVMRMLGSHPSRAQVYARDGQVTEYSATCNYGSCAGWTDATGQDPIVVFGNMCSSSNSNPTCPAGLTVRQQIPAKCANALREFPSTPLSTNASFGDPYSPYVSYQRLIEWSNPRPGSLAGQAGVVPIRFLVGIPGAHPYNLFSVSPPDSDLYFPVRNHTPEHFAGPAGDGTTSFTVTFAASSATIYSRLQLGGVEYLDECARVEGKVNSPFQAGWGGYQSGHSTIYRYRSDSSWTVCCD